jgi:hypothetical protein
MKLFLLETWFVLFVASGLIFSNVLKAAPVEVSAPSLGQNLPAPNTPLPYGTNLTPPSNLNPTSSNNLNSSPRIGSPSAPANLTNEVHFSFLPTNYIDPNDRRYWVRRRGTNRFYRALSSSETNSARGTNGFYREQGTNHVPSGAAPSNSLAAPTGLRILSSHIEQPTHE